MKRWSRCGLPETYETIGLDSFGCYYICPGAGGVACGSLFNFGDNNPLRAKAFLKNRGVCVKQIG